MMVGDLASSCIVYRDHPQHMFHYSATTIPAHHQCHCLFMQKICQRWKIHHHAGIVLEKYQYSSCFNSTKVCVNPSLIVFFQPKWHSQFPMVQPCPHRTQCHPRKAAISSTQRSRKLFVPSQIITLDLTILSYSFPLSSVLYAQHGTPTISS